MDKVYNLDWFTSASKNECSAAVGFKWMLNEGLMDYHEEIEQYFSTARVSLIFLFRRNLLRRMVSLLLLANIYDKRHKATEWNPQVSCTPRRRLKFLPSTNLESISLH